MKTIISMARQACDADKVDAWHGGFWTLTQEELERFATLVKAAHVDELVEGVEMPEPTYIWHEDPEDECSCEMYTYAVSGAVDESDVYKDGKCRFCTRLFTADQLRSTVAAAVLRKDAEIANLHTVMMAAAVETTEHWDAHCDEEGYGPANLVRRLENGYPEQYGYDAKTLVRIEVERDALKAENERKDAEIALLWADREEPHKKIALYVSESNRLERERDEFQRAADSMAMAHKEERDALRAESEKLREVLQEMVDMMDSGDEHGQGSPWHSKAQAAMKGQP